MARRLDWEKAAKIQKVKREGAEAGYDELPFVGSYADKRRYLEKKGYKEAKVRTIRLKKPTSAATNKDFGAIRQALEAIQRELVAVFDLEDSRLVASDVWQKLSSQERRYLRQRFDLQKPPPIKITTEEEINSTLRESSLANRRNLVAVMPRRFQSVLEEATRLVAPETTRFSPPKVTIRNHQELSGWLERSEIY